MGLFSQEEKSHCLQSPGRGHPAGFLLGMGATWELAWPGSLPPLNNCFSSGRSNVFLKRMMGRLGVPKTHLEMKEDDLGGDRAGRRHHLLRDFVNMMLKRSAVSQAVSTSCLSWVSGGRVTVCGRGSWLGT